MSTTPRHQVLSVNIGRARKLRIDGPRSVQSAIAKQPTDQPVSVHSLGLQGDEQADLSVHGGLAKAVYAYPSEHAGFWQTVRAQAGVAGWGDAVAPGLFGENLTLAGLLEADAWIGDQLRFPGCVLAVSEPRLPCFKFDAAMGFAQASQLMVDSGYCGFYLAVLVPGSIAAGQPFEIEPGPREVSIAELFRARRPKRSRRG